jgi:NADH dehydrogenase
LNVLITGGTGVIGRHAARLLAERGHGVRILSRRPTPDVPLLRGLPNVTFAQGDVRDPASLAAAFEGCDAAVLSHQFQNFPVENPKRAETFDAVDRLGTENCVRAALAAWKHPELVEGRLVYISGVALSHPNPPHPGVTAKLAAERAVFESGLSAIALRVNVVYAPDDKYFPKLARAARFSPVVPIFGNGQSRCAPIHVADVAQAIAHAVERPEVGGIVGVSGPDTVTWKMLLLTAAEVGAGGKRWPLHIPQRLLMAVGALGERLPTPPLSRAAVIFATQFDQSPTQPNCDAVFGFRVMGLREGLQRAFFTMAQRR